MSEEQVIDLHGRPVTYRVAGPESGPVIVLVHGIANTAASFVDTPDLLADSLGVRVIAPDLFRRGESHEIDTDTSLGGRAAVIRDLMVALHIPSATLIGHSLGGGVSLQFSYLFPRRVERLVLVASGGLGREVTPILRYATLPGSELLLSLLGSRVAQKASAAVDKSIDVAAVLAPDRFQPSHKETTRSVSSLADAALRASFVSTARHVLDRNGQRISALDRLYLAAHVPVLLIHGSKDRIIPAQHSIQGHEAIAHSRLEIIEGAGHFPHLDCADTFVELVGDFLSTTEPAHVDDDELARILAERSDEPDVLPPPAPSLGA